MGMRRSPSFKFRAKLIVVLILTGTVSPGMVWCHESDGSAKIAYGPCSAIPIPKSFTEASSFSRCVEAGCDSCVDTPVFTIGPTEDYSYQLADLIANMAAISPFSSPTDSDILPVTAISFASNEIYRSLASIRSTVLLI
jgi:hypothetical protein